MTRIRNWTAETNVECVPAHLLAGVRPGDWVETSKPSRQVAEVLTNWIRFTDGTEVRKINEGPTDRMTTDRPPFRAYDLAAAAMVTANDRLDETDYGTPDWCAAAQAALVAYDTALFEAMLLLGIASARKAAA